MKKIRKRTAEDYTIDTVNYVLLFLIFVATIYPFYYILINSLNEGLDAAKGGIYLLPRKFTFDNYEQFFRNSKWTQAFFITLARTLVGTVISVFFTCLVAYGLSYKNLIFKKAYFAIIIFSMYFTGGLIPYYVLLRSINLLDTFAVYVIPTALDVFFIMIAVSFLREIPKALIESARLDGAGDIKIFIYIILPISKPLIATMLLFVGVNQWNSWLDSAYFVKSDWLRTLPYRMMAIINQSFKPTDQQAAALVGEQASKSTSLSIQLAAMMVATIPIMVVYPFLQKHFIKGMMIGAVKG